jgi:hypothetical protein
MSHSLRTGMSAVRGAKGIVHIEVAKFGQRLRESRIILLFFLVETDILQQAPHRHCSCAH